MKCEIDLEYFRKKEIDYLKRIETIFKMNEGGYVTAGELEDLSKVLQVINQVMNSEYCFGYTCEEKYGDAKPTSDAPTDESESAAPAPSNDQPLEGAKDE